MHLACNNLKKFILTLYTLQDIIDVFAIDIGNILERIEGEYKLFEVVAGEVQQIKER